MLMGGMVVTILAALIWIKELRRQVGERTVQLSAEIRLRERTEHHHALEQERARIAKDLHDDLGATLTQIVYYSAQDISTLRGMFVRLVEGPRAGGRDAGPAPDQEEAEDG